MIEALILTAFFLPMGLLWYFQHRSLRKAELYVWNTSGDDRVRDRHAALDGPSRGPKEGSK